VIAPAKPGAHSRRGWVTEVGLRSALLVGLCGSLITAVRRWEHVGAQVGDLATFVDAQNTRLAAVAAGAGATRAEMAALRQNVTSRSRVTSTFFKCLVLKPDLDPVLAHQIAGIVDRYSERYGSDSNLVLAIIANESNFDPRARSPAGAVGLMQVMPLWTKVLKIEGDLTDPEVSVRYGVEVLGLYTEMYGDLAIVLTAYNTGPGRVDTALMRSKQPANQYAQRVIATYLRLKKIDAAVSI
jgi:hypothetical protein